MEQLKLQEIFSEIREFYGDGSCEILKANKEWIIPELENHPNVMFIKMKIPKIDCSNLNNDVLTIDGVRKRLKKMLYQPINLGFRKHNITRPIGVVYNASIDNEDLILDGIIWKQYFRKEADLIEKNKDNLGVSWEISGSKNGLKFIEASQNKEKNKYRIIEDEYDFTGFSILLNNFASYSDSSIEEIIAEIKKEKGGDLKNMDIFKDGKFIYEIAEKVMEITGKEKTEVQSLIFDKEYFTKEEAKKWAEEHGYKTYIDETENSYRMRQKEPEGYKRYRTIEFGKGIKAVIGILDVEDENKEKKSIKAELNEKGGENMEDRNEKCPECQNLQNELKKLKEDKELLQAEIRKCFGRERLAIYSSKISVDEREKESLSEILASMTEEQFKIVLDTAEKSKENINDVKIIAGVQAKSITTDEFVNKYWSETLNKLS